MKIRAVAAIAEKMIFEKGAKSRYLPKYFK